MNPLRGLLEAALLVLLACWLQFGTSVPTALPSTQPTPIPTFLPTHQPTVQPSGQPSRRPTAQPTRQPSRQPTGQPSRRPTVQPTGQPTRQPTGQPSRLPTAQPTGQPSRQPSRQPTGQPLARPSSQPSRQPSAQPTVQPSRRPTGQPTGRPTAQPSAQPSRQPTTQPSTQPTRQPTGQPSRQPTSQPTTQPTSQPSSQPTRQPTTQPTTQPTGRPTAQPSHQPTRKPSGQPSRRPSSQPTARPTRQPTGQPSQRPTGQPTRQPTRQPSEQPRSQPSSQPTRQPTRQPSGQPTRQPTARPTGQPSRQPTAQPTAQPTSQPSRQPTGQPTTQPTSQPTNHPLQPSGQPTRQPTMQPSGQPTRQPTSRPSSQPSRQPSAQPTEQPSRRPTGQPTGRPTAQPSAQPSRQPTTQPSTQPTRQPTGQPTTQPTGQPSNQPSQRPTGQPTRQPSGQPVASPTGQPSRQPTSRPTRQPTSKPSRQPSRQPSGQPTSQPTLQPTRQPSAQPSGQPSRQPSAQPSKQPVARPTGQPSRRPSSRPTARPSVPTGRPTQQPSRQPTSQPSSQPSRQPTARPSAQPTRQPTAVPSSRPSPAPSMPTPNPTRAVCPRGTFHENDAVCAACPYGKYSPIIDANACTACLPGYVTPTEGSTACTICPQGFYNDKTGSANPTDLSVCTLCPRGRTTPGLGSFLESQCLSPVANFAWGFVALGVSGVLALVYVVHGRFQQVAFIRRERVVKVQAEAYKKAFAQFEEYFKEVIGDAMSQKACSRIKNMRTARFKHTKKNQWFDLSTCMPKIYCLWEVIKILLFVMLSSVIVAFFGLICIVSLYASVFFKALIIWKQMHKLPEISLVILNFVKVMDSVVAIIGNVLNRFSLPNFLRVFIYVLFQPIYVLFELLANFKIDLSALNVTCAGAQAPLELALNMIILGIIIVIIQSEYQVFSGVIFSSAAARYGEIVDSREYNSQHASRSGDAGPKRWYKVVLDYILVPFKMVFAFIIQIVAQNVSFHSALQFIMSGVRISAFAENDGLHATSEACNQIEGAKGFDSLLAYLSTALAYVILPAAFYEVAKVICPTFDKGSDGLYSKLENAARVTLSRKALMNVPGAEGYKTSKQKSSSINTPQGPSSPSADAEGAEGGRGGDAAQPNQKEDVTGTGKVEGDVESSTAQESSRSPLSEDPDRKAHRDKDEENDVKDATEKICCKCPELTCDNFFWLIKLPSTLLAPDLILAFVSAQFPATLDGARPSRPPSKITPAAQSSKAEAGCCRGCFCEDAAEDAEQPPYWLFARFISLCRAVKDLWIHAQVPLEPYPLPKEVEEDEKFKEKFFLPSYWSLLVLEYREIFKTLSRSDGCDVRMGRGLRSLFLRLFSPGSVVKKSNEDIGPVGFVIVLLLGVTQLGHVCTQRGLLTIRVVLLRYLTFLKVCLGVWSKQSYQAYEVEDKVVEYSLRHPSALGKNRRNEIYTNTCASLVTTRAILIQTSPYLTILSVYAISIAKAPIYVLGDTTYRRESDFWKGDNKLWESNLFPLVVSDPFTRAKELEQVEKYKSRAWIRILGGIVIFITNSRLLSYMIAIYQVYFAVYILFTPSIQTLVLVSVFIFLPVSIAQSLKIVILAGKFFNIKDLTEVFSEKRVVHEKNTVEEELEKTPTVTGEMHIRHDEDGSLTFTHPEVLSFITDTLLFEEEFLEKRRLARLEKDFLTQKGQGQGQGQRQRRGTGRGEVRGMGQQGQDPKTPKKPTERHILEYILGDDDIISSKADKIKADKIKEKIDKMEQEEKEKDKQSKQSPWLSCARCELLWLRDLAASMWYADKAFDEEIEMKAVYDLIKKHNKDKPDHEPELFEKYLLKVSANVDKAIKASLPEGTKAEGVDAAVKRVVEDRVNKRLIEAGLKNVWFLLDKEGDKMVPRFIYHDVHRHIDRSILADSAQKTTLEINAELEENYAGTWLQNVEFRQGKYVFRDRGQIFKDEEAIFKDEVAMKVAMRRERNAEQETEGDIPEEDYRPPPPYYRPLTWKFDHDPDSEVTSRLKGSLSQLKDPANETKVERAKVPLDLQESLFLSTTESLRMLVLSKRAVQKNKELYEKKEKEEEKEEREDKEDKEDKEEKTRWCAWLCPPSREAEEKCESEKVEQEKKDEKDPAVSRMTQAAHWAAGGMSAAFSCLRSGCRGQSTDDPSKDIEQGQVPAEARDEEENRQKKKEGRHVDAPRLPVSPSRVNFSAAAAGGGRRETENPFRQSQHYREPGVQGDWVSKVSKSTGRPYWNNVQTGESTYNDPFGDKGKGRGKDKDKEPLATPRRPDPIPSQVKVTENPFLKRREQGAREDDEERQREKEKKRREREKGSMGGSPAMNMGDFYPPEKEHGGSHAAAAAVNAAEKADKAKREKVQSRGEESKSSTHRHSPDGHRREHHHSKRGEEEKEKEMQRAREKADKAKQSKELSREGEKKTGTQRPSPHGHHREHHHSKSGEERSATVPDAKRSEKKSNH